MAAIDDLLRDLADIPAETQPQKVKRRSRDFEEAILKDVVKLASTYGLEIKTAVRADLAPDEAIVKETARRRSNLVVLGVGRRPGEKLFFVDTAAALLGFLAASRAVPPHRVAS